MYIGVSLKLRGFVYTYILQTTKKELYFMGHKQCDQMLEQKLPNFP